MGFDSKISDKPIWLIRSSSRILGPYLLDEVIDLLKRKQISIIDEVRRPDNRWSYIRDYEEFEEVVNNLRLEIDNAKDDTMTMTSNTQSTQLTVTASLSESEDFKDDLTPIVSTQPPIKNVSNQSEKVVTEVASKEVKSYGNSQDPRLLKQVEASNRRWVIGLSVVAIIGILFFGFNALKKSKDRMNSHFDSIAKAIRFKNVGLYDKSLLNYKKGSLIKEPPFDAQVQMALLLIAKDGQTTSGRRVLEKALLQEGLTQSTTIEYLLSIGYSYLREGDYKSAEDFFQKVLGYDPNNISAGLNVAIIKINNKNFEGANTDLEGLSKRTKNHPLIHIARAIVGAELHSKKRNPELLHQIYFDLREYAENKNFMRQKVSLMQAYLAMLLEEKLEVNRALMNFLEQPINEDDNYLQDLTVDWRMANWDNLEKYCTRLYQRNSQFPLFASAMAICMMSQKRELEAIKLISEVGPMAQKEPLVKLTEVNILFRAGKVSEARLLIKPYETSNLKLANYLLGQICMAQQNYSCLEKSSLALSADSPIQAYGLAVAALKQSRRGEALERVKTGLASEANYIPLIDFRDQLEILSAE